MREGVPFIEKISEIAVQQTLIPKLVDLANAIKDATLVSSCIKCLSICLDKVDNDQFLRNSLPKVYEAWRKNQNASVALSMCEMIEKLQATPKTLVNRAIPVAADITSSQVTEAYVQKRLCNWMINTLNSYKKAGRLDEAIDPQPEPTSTTNSAQPTPVMDAATLKSFEDFSLPAKSSTTTSNSGMNNFDFGFGSNTSSTTTTTAAKSTLGSGSGNATTPSTSVFGSSSSKPPSAARSEFGFGSTPSKPAQNDFGFGSSASSGTSAFKSNQTQQPSNAFGNPPASSGDFDPFGQNSPKNAFGSPAPPKQNTSAFGAQQKPISQKNDFGFGAPPSNNNNNEFNPFGSPQPPSQPTPGRPLRTVPGGNQFGSPGGGGFSPSQRNPQNQNGNDLLNLF